MDIRDCKKIEVPKLWTTDAEGCDVEIELPWNWGVCPVCNGSGTHVNPNIDRNGLSEQDFHDDPDLEQHYRSGLYDIQCNGCEGRTTVPVIDKKRADPAQLKQYWEQLDTINAEAVFEDRCARYGIQY